jgi:hypothetical protein
MRHRRFVPIGFAELSPFQSRCHNVVPVLEDIRFHGEIVAGDAFHHVAPAVDNRLQILDDGGGKSPEHGPSIN